MDSITRATATIDREAISAGCHHDSCTWFQPARRQSRRTFSLSHPQDSSSFQPATATIDRDSGSRSTPTRRFCFNPRDRRQRSRRGRTFALHRAEARVSTRTTADNDRDLTPVSGIDAWEASFNPRDRRQRSRHQCPPSRRVTTGYFNPRDRRQRSRRGSLLLRESAQCAVSTRATADNDRDRHRASLEQLRPSGLNPRDRNHRSRLGPFRNPLRNPSLFQPARPQPSIATADRERARAVHRPGFNPRDRNHRSRLVDGTTKPIRSGCFNPRDRNHRSRRGTEHERRIGHRCFNPRDRNHRSRQQYPTIQQCR